MSATVSAFGRGGITYVTGEGEGGTQRNEFEAAIKSVTSSTTVGAVFIYDTSQDSDGGAWRKKTSHTSWAREVSSTTRSARSEFPAMALIVADNPNASGTTKTVTIYDLDDPAMPMWMVFNCDSTSWETNATFISCSITENVSYDTSAIGALNGRLYVSGGSGVVEVDFLTEAQTNYGRPDLSTTAVIRHKKSGQIADRNDTSGNFSVTGTPVVDRTCNDVAMTVLEGAPIGALGLPEVTTAVATNGGVSVIHANGDVYDIIASSGPTVAYKIALTDDAKIVFHASDTAASTDYAHVYVVTVPYADTSVAYFYSLSGEDYTYSVPTGTNFNAISGGLSTDVTAISPAGENLAIGSNVGLSVIKRNTGNVAESAVAYITSTYNTGYMVGDIRGAWITNGSSASDRSVKANGLTQPGSSNLPAQAVVATGAELLCQAGFSANDYLSQAYDADFDFGTGDFSVMFWVKASQFTGAQAVVGRSDGLASHRWLGYFSASSFYFYTSNGTPVRAYAANPPANVWVQVVMVRRSNILSIYYDGKEMPVTTVGSGAVDITSTSSSPLMVGVESYNQGVSVTNLAAYLSLSLLRISKTAPTPQQIADIYAAEKPLFAEDAKCLLDTTSVVNDLAYDKSSGLLYSADGLTTGDVFRGLERVDTIDSATIGHSSAATTLEKLSAAGGVLAGSSAANAGVNLPSIDVRADLNEGESKLPDDGKLHFEASIYGATPTVIANIPIAENERYKLYLKASGETWPAQAGHWIDVTMEETFFRKVGDNVVQRGESSKLANESLASMDINLIVDTSANTIQVQVTGVTSTQIVWTASVEVQRISEKTYER